MKKWIMWLLLKSKKNPEAKVESKTEEKISKVSR